MAKLSDDDLLRQLQAYEDDASRYVDLISPQRLSSLREYYREPYEGDDELDGWSTIVTSEVQDTVEWVLPELLDVFTSTDKAVEFEPRKAQDVQGAEQATDTCNYVFYQQNNGFLTLYTAFKDALMVQNCAVMWRTETEQVKDRQQVRGVPIEVLAMLVDQGYKIDESAPVYGPAQPLFNANLSLVRDKKIVKVEAFPPDQLLIKSDWNSPLLSKCPYVCRMLEVTLSDLRQMGFKNVTAQDLRTSERRESVAEEYREQQHGDFDDDDLGDESQTTGWLRIEFVLVDKDGDGIAERQIIYRLDEKILSREDCDDVQIATASPILNTHNWSGVSLAEIMSDLQRLKTDMTRSMVNAGLLAVNPRKVVLTDSQGSPYVDVDDLLDFRIGGVIRQKKENALSVEPSPFTGHQMLPILGYLDEMGQKRTGVSEQQQGLDPNALRPDRTASEVMMTANAAKQRIRLIARIFAEILLKPVFRGIFKLLTDGDMEPIAYRLRGQFVQYDPNEWRDEYDMTINVGLGTGDKQQQAAQFHQLMQMQMSLAQTPFGQMMIQPQNIYATASKIVELLGQKNVGDFIGDPQGQPLPKSGPPPQVMIEQAKMQMQGQMKQMEMQASAREAELKRQQEAQLEMLRAQAQQATDANRQEMEARQHQLKIQNEAQIQALKAQYEDQRHQREMEFQRWKAELEAAVKIESANISSQSKVIDPATVAATGEIGREVQP